MSQARFVRKIGDRDRELVVHHDMLRDKVRVVCDDERIHTGLIRKPFSGLFRYPFEIDGERLEVRVRSGLIEPEIELVNADEPIVAKKLGWIMYAIIALMCATMVVGLRVTLMRDAAVTVLVFLGVVTFAVTSALIHVVYERRS